MGERELVVSAEMERLLMDVKLSVVAGGLELSALTCRVEPCVRRNGFGTVTVRCDAR